MKTKYKSGTFNVVPNKNYLRGKPAELQAIYFWIVDHANDEGICFPQRSTLAKEAGCNVKTVDKYIQALVEYGFIEKTVRKLSGNKKQLSNIYQLLSMSEAPFLPEPSTENGQLRDTENGAVTIPTCNTHITISDTNVSEAEVVDLPKQEEVKPIVVGQLPNKFGKNYIDRIIFVYRTLWGAKFNTPYQITSFGKIGKMIKTLVSNNTEYQVALLLLTHFNWRGATGTDDKEYMFLSSKGFPLELLPNKINIYIAYLTNVIGLDYNNEDSVKEYVVKNLKPLIK